MNPTPHTWKEARRLQAWHLREKGWPQRHIAEALGVSAAAVSQWLKRARQDGPQALRHRPPPGAPRRLAADLLARLPDEAAIARWRTETWPALNRGRKRSSRRSSSSMKRASIPYPAWCAPMH